jgi:hypothetical protein
MMDGLKCYVGINSITCDDDDDCEADDCNPQAPMFVNIYLIFNQFYNLLIILILKYGSANLLYLALTLMVPLGNVAFTLPFIPESQTLKPTDIIGLIVICSGLGCYRFAAKLVAAYNDKYYPKGSFARNSIDGHRKSEEDAKAFASVVGGEEEQNPLR